MKTPYYEIDYKQLDENYNKLEKALQKYWGQYVIGYSYKTNALPWLIEFFQGKGCYAEVVSDDEYELSKLLNTPKGNCIYNGPIKTKDTFIEAVLDGCIVNIDSKRELEWIDTIPAGDNYRIGIRVNFDVEKECLGQSACGDEGGRFGFCYENGELEKAIHAMKEKGYKVSGLHLHTSSKTRSIDIYDSISKKACEIAKRYSLELDYVDIGGGFFGGVPSKPQFDEYISVISKNLTQQFSLEQTTLIIEPGMCLVGAPISYVTSVIDVKDTTYNRFVVTDGSRTNIDPLMGKTNYFYHIEKKQPAEPIEKQVICGFTCMEPDRLMVLEDAPELRVGDKIVYEKVGAYTMCLTPLFIKYFPDVYVRDDDKIKIARRKWSAKEYVQNGIID